MWEMASPSSERSGPSPGAPLRSPPAARPHGGSVAAESGWVLPALLALLAGSGYLFGLAWLHVRAKAAPPPLLAAAVLVVVGVLAFSQAASVALDPARPPEWWRPAVAALVFAGAAALVFAAPRRAALALIPGVALCALSARAAETVGAHLASAVRLPEDDATGDWSRQAPETRRIVLETWVLAAAAAALAGRAPGVTPALALAAGGGLALAAGSHLHALRRLCANEGFDWERADAVAALRWAGALSAAVLAVAIAVPAVPALVPRGIPDAVRLLLKVLFLHRATPSALPHRTAPTPGAIPVAGVALPLPVGQSGSGVSPGILRFLAFDLQDWLILGVAAVVLSVVLVQYLRFAREIGGGLGGLFRRLWEALVSILAFWRWLDALRPPASRLAGARAGDGAMAASGPPDDAPFSLLDPRRAVRASYRRLLRHAAGAGVARAPGESPARFELQVAERVGGAAPDAAALTRAYEEARYSHHPIARQRVPLVRAALDRILRALSAGPAAPGRGGGGRGMPRRAPPG